MRTWPRTPGVVWSASIYSRRRHHRPLFVVSYSFQEARFKTECDSPTRSGYSEHRGALALLARYPVGSQVNLYVDPADPSRAFLWRPELHMLIVFLAGAAVLFLATLVGCIAAFELDPIEYFAC